MKKKSISCILVIALLMSMFTGIFIPEVSAANLKDNLELELKFDNSIADTSTNNINGTLTGSAIYVDGKVGKAIKLDGKSSIDLGTSADLQPANLTVSFWVKPEAKLSGEQMITWFKPSGKYNGDGWYLSCLSDTVPLKLSTGTGVQESYVSGDRSAFFPVGQWTHVVVTYDSATRNVAIYRNGIAQTVSYNIQTGSIASNSTDHKYIGFNSPGYNGGYANLDLDEFKIYSTVATESEARSIYKEEGGSLSVTGISLDKSVMDIDAGQTSQLTATVLPSDASDTAVTWSSSDETVAKVDQTGLVTAIKEGTAKISAVTNDGGHSAECLVTVTGSNIDSSLELELKFEDNITDSSGNSISGILNGPATYVTGQSGKAIKLNGNNNYIDLGTSADLQPANLTVSFWVKPEAKLSGEQMIAWFKPSGSWNGNGWYLSCLNDSTPLKLSTGTGVQESYVSGDRSKFFPVGEWTHIVVTYDSNTRNVTIYRNGIAQTVSYNKQAGSIASNSTDHKYIGFNSPGYNGGYANLDLDELKIYSTVATAKEIRKIYNNEGGTLTDNDIAQIDLDALSIPATTRGNLTLPTSGRNGSTISWISSNPGIISTSGAIAIPAADTQVTLSATAAYGTASLTKDFTVTAKSIGNIDVELLEQFGMDEVNITDDYYVNAFNKDVNYLLSLNADRLLRGFRDVAGITSNAALYGGWEDSWSYLRGHTLGHYMTAIAQAYEETKDDTDLTLNTRLKNQIDYIINGLKECQDKSATGYLFATPETHFDVIEGKATGSSWVPWYTMHKIISGLLDVYKYEGNETALQIASKLGDWTYKRTSTWDDATHTKVLNVEYGGMNDCLYELYKITKSVNHLTAAHMFDEDSLFTPIAAGTDILANKHANTQIPKFIGALNRYRTLGEDESFYLTAAEKFWDIVVKDHTYVTGGNSENEHFRAAGQLDSTRDNINDESCNSYNMLKLSRELYKITGDIKYANFYEKTYINEIMASQNPETGMFTYFKPMGTGYFKAFCSETNDFWCCTGTGMENFTKLDDSLYYHTENDLYVNMYLSSTLNWIKKGLALTQKANIPDSEKVTFTINNAPSEEVNIKFRSPEWIAKGQTVVVSVNGQKLDVKAENGYINVKRVWSAGDTVVLTIPMEVQVSRLPDNGEAVAFTYGPVVLSAGLGTEDMKISGHLASKKATIPEGVNIKDYIIIKNGTFDNWINNIKENLVKTNGKLEFTLKNTDEDGNLTFTPYYSRYKDRYGIYFYLSAIDSESFQKTVLNKKTAAKKQSAIIDEVQVTNDQHELAHNLVVSNSSTGYYNGYNYRTARGTNDGDAWFSYDMKVDPSVKNYLCVIYYKGDSGRSFNIYVDNQLLRKETLATNNNEFYDVLYEIPANLISGKQKVTIKFSNIGTSNVGSLYNTVSITKDYDKNAQLKSVTVDGAAAVLTDSNYDVSAPKGSTTAAVKITPTNANALVYVGNTLIDDTVDRNVTLESGTTKLNIKVVAEDNTIEKAYTINITKQQSVSVTGVTLNNTELSLKTGSAATLVATVAPSDAANKDVTWTSSNAGVATVDSTGKVTAVAAGTANITVTTKDGGYPATCKVTVSAEGSVNVSSIIVSSTNGLDSVNNGSSLEMTASVMPLNASDSTVKWSVENGTGSATITSTGTSIALLTATGVGTVTVKATANDGSGVVGKKVITITAASGSGQYIPPKDESPSVPKENKPTDKPVDKPVKAFSDVENFGWAKNAIENLAEKGIISGTSESTFSPSKKITRADFLVMLVKAMGLKSDFDTNFADVNKQDYYYNALGVAKELGIATGTGENRFNPKAEITRQDIMVLITKALKVANKSFESGTAENIANFADSDSISSYALEAAAILVKNQIISGDGTNINPKSNATRAETAVIIYKVFDKYCK